VLVVEDVVTTGGRVAEVIERVRAAGGAVEAVTSIIDRGGDKAFDAEYLPLLRLEVESMEPRECPQCAAGSAIDSPGSRRLS
jgi:orotate phosphoribosyltransferase